MRGIIKTSVEHAMDLPVKMPVKVKVGVSWGRLKKYSAMLVKFGM